MSDTEVPAAHLSAGRRHRSMTIFGGLSVITVLAGSSAPTPLYRLYQESWNLSPAILTTIFAVYALSLLASLLTVGSLSDHVGRRPVISVAMAVSAVAMAMFMEAGSAGALIAARVVQGLATGAATGTLAAAIVDSNRSGGAIVNSVTPFVGMAVGVLASGTLAVYGPSPTTLIYLVLMAIFIALAIAVWWMPETVSRKPGAWRSLLPRIAVPPQARQRLFLITPVSVSAWALGGFYLSLMPSLLRLTAGTLSGVAVGAVVAALPLTGALAILLGRSLPATPMLIASAPILALGVAITLVGVHHGLAVLLVSGTIVAGLGCGSAFFGAVRSLFPLAAPHQRAGLVSAYYVQSYLAFSLPAIVAGALIPSLGLRAVAGWYGGIVILLALVSLAASMAALRQVEAAGN